MDLLTYTNRASSILGISHPACLSYNRTTHISLHTCPVLHTKAQAASASLLYLTRLIWNVNQYQKFTKTTHSHDVPCLRRSLHVQSVSACPCAHMWLRGALIGSLLVVDRVCLTNVCKACIAELDGEPLAVVCICSNSDFLTMCSSEFTNSIASCQRSLPHCWLLQEGYPVMHYLVHASRL